MRSVLSLLVTAVLLAQAAAISGFVREAGTGEPIAFATVELEGTEIGALSGKNGYYLLTLVPAGVYVVSFVTIGYQLKNDTVTVTPEQELRLDVRLKPEPVTVLGQTVTAERARFKQEVDVSVRQLQHQELRMSPGVFDQDLFKSLQIMPGVVAISDFSSALYIRGGSPDQNSVLIDGVEIYNPYHLGGFFSTFSLDAIRSAELHSGAFPARFGNAVSSVLDVDLKEGNTQRYQGTWDLNLLSAKATVEGPLPRGSFLIAGRRTYLDAMSWGISKAFKIEEAYLPYYFYDLQAKANFDLTPKHRLTASGFFGDDVIYLATEDSKNDFKWGNLALGLKWRYLITPSLVSNLLLMRGRYRVALNGAYYQELDSIRRDTVTTELGMGVGNWGGRYDLDWFPNPNHSLKLGAQVQFLDVSDRLGEDTFVYFNLHERPLQAVLHGTDKWHVLPPLWVEAGVRAEYFSGGSCFRVAPRIGAKYLLDDDFALKAGYGHHYQYLSIPYPRDEMTMKLPLFMFQQWVPATSTNPPVSAVHYGLGAEKWFPGDMNLSLEAYYKSLDNLLESDLPFSFPLVPDSLSFTRGSGWATGVELLFKRKNSWLGYNFAIARREFDSVSYYPIFDARHSFNVAWGVPLGKGWNLSLQWLLRTGFPYTGPVGRYQQVSPYGDQWWFNWVYIDGSRSGSRYPPYHRLDLAVEKSFKLAGMNCTAYLQVVNAYWQKNVMYYEFTTDWAGRPERKPVYMIPFPIPSFGVRGEF